MKLLIVLVVILSFSIMILYQLLKLMVQLLQIIVRRGVCFTYSIKFITYLLDTYRKKSVRTVKEQISELFIP